MRVLLATDGSTDALTATRWLRHFPLPEESSEPVKKSASAPHIPIDHSVRVCEERRNAHDAEVRR